MFGRIFNKDSNKGPVPESVEISPAIQVLRKPGQNDEYAEIIPVIDQIRSMDKITMLRLLAELKEFAKQKETHKELCECLRVLNDEGLSFGLAIAKYQDCEQSDEITVPGSPSIDYLELLKCMLDHGVDVQEIYSILAMQDTAGTNTGMYIANHENEDAVLAYLELLDKLILRGVYAKDVFALFRIYDKVTKINFAMSVTKYHNDRSQLKMLNLLKTMHQYGVPADDFLQLLDYSDQTNTNLCMEAVFYQSDESVHQLLDFLMYLLKSGADAKRLLALITKQSTTGMAGVFEFIIIHDSAAIQKLFILLLAVSTNDEMVKENIGYLIRTAFKFDEDGSNYLINMCRYINTIMCYSTDAEAIAQLLKSGASDGESILFRLVRNITEQNAVVCVHMMSQLNDAGAKFETLIELSRSHDKSGRTIGMELAMRQRHKTAFISYLNFLELLLKSTHRKDLVGKIFTADTCKDPLTGRLNWTLTDFVIGYQDVSVLFRLAGSGLLPDEEYKKLVPKLPEILVYLNQFKGIEKEKLLLRALNRIDPLGMLFHQDRYMPSAATIRLQLQDELTVLRKATREKMRSTLFAHINKAQLSDNVPTNNLKIGN